VKEAKVARGLPSFATIEIDTVVKACMSPTPAVDFRLKGKNKKKQAIERSKSW
jgi:hypothetical protein